MNNKVTSSDKDVLDAPAIAVSNADTVITLARIIKDKAASEEDNKALKDYINKLHKKGLPWEYIRYYRPGENFFIGSNEDGFASCDITLASTVFTVVQSADGCKYEVQYKKKPILNTEQSRGIRYNSPHKYNWQGHDNLPDWIWPTPKEYEDKIRKLIKSCLSKPIQILVDDGVPEGLLKDNASGMYQLIYENPPDKMLKDMGIKLQYIGLVQDQIRSRLHAISLRICPFVQAEPVAFYNDEDNVLYKLYGVAVEAGRKSLVEQSSKLKLQLINFVEALSGGLSQRIGNFKHEKQQLLNNALQNLLQNGDTINALNTSAFLVNIFQVVMQHRFSSKGTTASTKVALGLLNSGDFDELANLIKDEMELRVADRNKLFTVQDLNIFLEMNSVESENFSSENAKTRFTALNTNNLLFESPDKISKRNADILLAMDKTLAGLTSSRGTKKEESLRQYRDEFVKSVINNDSELADAHLYMFAKQVKERVGGFWGLHFWSTAKSADIFHKTLSQEAQSYLKTVSETIENKINSNDQSSFK